MKSCVTVSSKREKGYSLSSTTRVDGILVRTEDVNEHVAIEATVMGLPVVSAAPQSVIISSSLVCSLKFGRYLRIEPEIVWVLPDLCVDNDVITNTKWNVD